MSLPYAIVELKDEAKSRRLISSKWFTTKTQKRVKIPSEKDEVKMSQMLEASSATSDNKGIMFDKKTIEVGLVIGEFGNHFLFSCSILFINTGCHFQTLITQQNWNSKKFQTKSTQSNAHKLKKNRKMNPIYHQNHTLMTLLPQFYNRKPPKAL